jgi:DNA-binding NtrC family response regulator
MPSLWIVHRCPRSRAALDRLAGQVEDVVSGAPGDTHFEVAAPPEVVLLGLSAAEVSPGGWEPELAFASQLHARVPAALWLLTGPPRAEAEARRLFDNLQLEYLPYPPEAAQLRERVTSRAHTPAIATLSERAARDALARRFARWYGDLDLPELLRALDPNLAPVPVLIRGERGTGRGLVVRYLHTFGLEGAALVHVPCQPSMTMHEIEALLRSAQSAAGQSLARGATVWLEDLEQLPKTTQQQLQAWAQGITLPRGIRAPFVRLVATTTPDDALQQAEPSLLRSLALLHIELPPLRERGKRIGAIASETLADWCHARRLPPRRLGEDSLEVLEQCAWPGNLQELESVVLESAVTASSDPITSTELRSGGSPFAPLADARILEAEESEAAPMPPVETAAAQPSPPQPSKPAATPAPTPAPAPAATSEPDPAAPSIPPSPAPVVPREPASAPPLARLAAALSAEIREPLGTIQDLAELPDERFQDAALRARIADAIGRDATRIERLVERIEELGRLEPPKREPVDIVTLLEDLLRPHEATIRSRRLLVLKELDAAHPLAMGDPDQLRLALTALIDKAFDLVPERGDLYIASRHHSARSGADTIRILIRFHSPDRAADLPHIDQSVEIIVAETVVQSMGGRVAVSSTEGEDALVLLDLPAAEADARS